METAKAALPVPDAPPEPGPAAPFALVARQGNALRLAAVDPVAQAAGLVAGMTLADARARVPELGTVPYDGGAAEARALARIVRNMARFSPIAAADGADGVILDITGCAHLFGGEAALARLALDAAGHAARMGLAGNAAAARALARHGRMGEAAGEDVGALPVAALEPGEEVLVALRRAGLRTLADLAARPAAALAARFGGELVLRLRQVLGEAASPVSAPRPAAPLRLDARFADPIARTEDVLDVIEDLIRQAGARLEAERLGGRRFVVTLCRSDGARRRLAVDTGQPVREPAPVIRLLRERIDSLSDPLDPGFGFDSVHLAIPRTEPLAPRQIALDRKDETLAGSVAALVDRLAVRLGPDNVYSLAPADRHLPEVAQAKAPPLAGPGGIGGGNTPPRPLWLYDPPQPIEVIAGVPDGPPQRFRWQGQVHAVRLAEGPERIAAEWWRHEDAHRGTVDTASFTRDYYRIEDDAGRRYWVFRNGLFDERPNPRWFLHGLFA